MLPIIQSLNLRKRFYETRIFECVKKRDGLGLPEAEGLPKQEDSDYCGSVQPDRVHGVC
jgi:hypothetical protein